MARRTIWSSSRNWGPSTLCRGRSRIYRKLTKRLYWPWKKRGTNTGKRWNTHIHSSTYSILLQLQTISLPIFSHLPDLSCGGIPGQRVRWRAWALVWHFVQGADSSPGRAQDPCFYVTGWERPSPPRGWGEWKETGGGAQTQRRRWYLQTSTYLYHILTKSVQRSYCLL